MKISKNGQYALLCVTDLAMNSEDGHESIAHIAERQKIDPNYLSQIFFVLKKAGIISGIRGKSGGYFLSKQPSQITAGDIVRAVEGDLAPTPCSIGKDASQSCDTYDACITRTLWQEIAKQINATLDNMTVADIIEKYQKGSNSNGVK